MSTFNTGAYPPGCRQRDVDMAQPGERGCPPEPDEPAPPPVRIYSAGGFVLGADANAPEWKSRRHK